MGRTELVTAAVASAESLFHSAKKLRALPDHLVVLPGAFAGSVCGRGLSGVPISTLGFDVGSIARWPSRIPRRSSGT